MRKILIMGLPGAGKTTLARMLINGMRNRDIPVVHFNADEVRQNINKDLQFSPDDRIEHSRRLSWLADTVVKGGAYCVCDFVCPLPETRKVFNADIAVFVDTIKVSRFDDTNSMFVRPTEIPTIEVSHWIDEGSFELEALINALL